MGSEVSLHLPPSLTPSLPLLSFFFYFDIRIFIITNKARAERGKVESVCVLKDKKTNLEDIKNPRILIQGLRGNVENTSADRFRPLHWGLFYCAFPLSSSPERGERQYFCSSVFSLAFEDVFNIHQGVVRSPDQKVFQKISLQILKMKGGNKRQREKGRYGWGWR